MNLGPDGRPIERREFLRLMGLLGSAAAVTAFLQACQKAGIIATPGNTPMYPPAATTTSSEAAMKPPAEITPSPSPQATLTPRSGTARVALVRTGDRSAGVRQAIELLGENPVTGKDVFLKPNYNSSDVAPGSTHLDILRSLVLKLRELGAGKITVGDRSGMGDTRGVLQLRGVFKLAEELDFQVIVFDELPAEAWVRSDPPGSHWERGFYLPRLVLESPAVVQACCLKTHRYGGHFTLSLKNSVGLAAKQLPGDSYNFMHELHGRPHQRSMIAEINAAYNPALIVLDGVEAFVNGGPDWGKKVRPEVVLAGSDRIAIDAVGVAILRMYRTTKEVSRGAIFEQEQIARAVELHLGIDSPDKIELLTGDAAGAEFAGRVGEILLEGV